MIRLGSACTIDMFPCGAEKILEWARRRVTPKPISTACNFHAEGDGLGREPPWGLSGQIHAGRRSYTVLPIVSGKRERGMIRHAHGRSGWETATAAAISLGVLSLTGFAVAFALFVT